MGQHSALTWLHTYGRRYPSAWDAYARLLNDPPMEWPQWCWCPLAGTYAVLSQGTERSLSTEEARDVGPLGALAAWRATQGIYRVHPTLLRELLDTPVLGEIPPAVLERLPEWCVYVETPGHRLWTLDLAGYWAYLEHDINTARRELRIVLDVVGVEQLGQVIIHLGGTLHDGLRAAVSEARVQALRAGQPDIAPSLAAINGQEVELGGLVSVLLYLCADEPEIEGRVPLPPKTALTKKGRVIMPTAARPLVHECGYRLGARLDAALQAASESDSGTGTKIAPHVRRAHWHSYWMGPRDGERRASLRWLSPMLVGGAPETAVVRPVGAP